MNLFHLYGFPAENRKTLGVDVQMGLPQAQRNLLVLPVSAWCMTVFVRFYSGSAAGHLFFWPVKALADWERVVM